jgi:ElaB/YqjD/DUF883 family membrane-anchored ribosome-binding protein
MNKTARSQDRLRDKVSETRTNIAEMGHLAKESVQEKLREIKERASDSYDDGKERLQELGERFARKVRESPMKSVLIAAGVGLALGAIWRRR